MTEQPFLYRNAANIVSLLGVLPLCLLFMEGGFQYLIPLIIYNNVMDDLDGILAAKMNIRSQFGAHLDNVCDAVAHGMITMAVGMHFGGWVMLFALMAAGAAILRSTARLDPKSRVKGSPTNELMRHTLFTFLIASLFGFDPTLLLILIFICHSVTMVASFSIPGMIRSRATTATNVVLVNVSLLVAWLIPFLTVIIALAYVITYFYGVYQGVSLQKQAMSVEQ